MFDLGLRITKLIAVALVVFPEPITTAVGLLMLAGAAFLSRKLHRGVLKMNRV
jgi:hypothetical protein